MSKQQFAEIRRYLGKSQAQLSVLLCISPKTIQSFEQGLRQVSPHVERQLLFLLSLKRIVDKSILPCWEIQDCPKDWRKQCSAWEYQAGQLCWYITGTFCKGECQENWEKKLNICKKCKVFDILIPWMSALS